VQSQGLPWPRDSRPTNRLIRVRSRQALPIALRKWPGECRLSQRGAAVRNERRRG
jgi:hypothetical protein